MWLKIGGRSSKPPGRLKHLLGMWALVVRHPIAGSIVMWVVLLSLTSTCVEMRGDVHPQWWATALVFLAIAYGSGVTWYFAYKKPPAHLPLVKVAGFIYAMVLSPYLIAAALIFLGAALYSLWVTFAVTGVQFSWYAWRLHTRETADPR
jgi:hypothetical protein